MSSPGFALGIDLGTSNTVAVLRWPDGRAKPLLFDGSPLLPSAVYAEASGGLLVGRDAVHAARIDPARYEPNPKRRIDDGTVLLGERELPVTALAAAILGRVTEEARRTTGGPMPTECTLTCPAGWAATRRAVLTQAAASVGLPPVRLVEEPVAAAAYFVNVLGRVVPVGSVVVVHDFGAGTFDASVVARTATGFEVLAVDGRGDIGGLDIDAVIVAHVATLCSQRDPAGWARLASPATAEDRRFRRMLWDDVRGLKERLSRAQSAEIVVPVLNADVHLTRQELERLAEPMLKQTVAVTQGAMNWAQIAAGRLAGVFLVGGSSRIPLVATLLHRALGEPPVVIEQPELVVAEGSLFAGAAAPTAPSATVSFSRASLAQPTQAPPLVGAPVSGGPVPGAPVSGGPVSGAPMSGVPVSGVPVSGGPVSGGPVSGGPGATPVPGTGRPVSGAPAGVLGSGSPGFGAPVSGGPVSGAPVSASPVSPVPASGYTGPPPVPGYTGPPPVPGYAGPPPGPGYAAGPPVASPVPSFQSGRAVIPDPRPLPGQPPAGAGRAAMPSTQAMPRYPEPYRAPEVRGPVQSEPGYPADPYGYAEPEPSGGAGRVLRVALVTILLVATPVVSGYIAYRLARA